METHWPGLNLIRFLPLTLHPRAGVELEHLVFANSENTGPWLRKRTSGELGRQAGTMPWGVALCLWRDSPTSLQGAPRALSHYKGKSWPAWGIPEEPQHDSELWLNLWFETVLWLPRWLGEGIWSWEELNLVTRMNPTAMVCVKGLVRLELGKTVMIWGNFSKIPSLGDAWHSWELWPPSVSWAQLSPSCLSPHPQIII